MRCAETIYRWDHKDSGALHLSHIRKHLAVFIREEDLPAMRSLERICNHKLGFNDVHVKETTELVVSLLDRAKQQVAACPGRLLSQELAVSIKKSCDSLMHFRAYFDTLPVEVYGLAN